MIKHLLLSAALSCLITFPTHADMIIYSETDVTPQRAQEVVIEPVYKAITMTDQEADELRQVLWLEGNDQRFEAQCKNCEVIFNRVLSPEFPNTVHGVLSQRRQFSVWSYRHKAKPDEMTDDVISEVLRETATRLPDTRYVFFATYKANGKDFVYDNGHYYSR